MAGGMEFAWIEWRLRQDGETLCMKTINRLYLFPESHDNNVRFNHEDAGAKSHWSYCEQRRMMFIEFEATSYKKAYNRRHALRHEADDMYILIDRTDQIYNDPLVWSPESVPHFNKNLITMEKITIPARPSIIRSADS